MQALVKLFSFPKNIKMRIQTQQYKNGTFMLNTKFKIKLLKVSFTFMVS